MIRSGGDRKLRLVIGTWLAYTTTMTPKLRPIRTRHRDASVTRSEVASVMKAVVKAREKASGQAAQKGPHPKRVSKTRRNMDA